MRRWHVRRGKWRCATASQPHTARAPPELRQLSTDHVLPELGALAAQRHQAHVIQAPSSEEAEGARASPHETLRDRRPAGSNRSTSGRHRPAARNPVGNMFAVLPDDLNHAVDRRAARHKPRGRNSGRSSRVMPRPAGPRGDLRDRSSPLILKMAKKALTDHELYFRTLFLHRPPARRAPRLAIGRLEFPARPSSTILRASGPPRASFCR